MVSFSCGPVGLRSDLYGTGFAVGAVLVEIIEGESGRNDLICESPAAGGSSVRRTIEFLPSGSLWGPMLNVPVRSNAPEIKGVAGVEPRASFTCMTVGGRSSQNPYSSSCRVWGMGVSKIVQGTGCDCFTMYPRIRTFRPSRLRIFSEYSRPCLPTGLKNSLNLSSTTPSGSGGRLRASVGILGSSINLVPIDRVTTRLRPATFRTGGFVLLLWNTSSPASTETMPAINHINPRFIEKISAT
jgi:hypothetical protein